MSTQRRGDCELGDKIKFCRERGIYVIVLTPFLYRYLEQHGHDMRYYVVSEAIPGREG